MSDPQPQPTYYAQPAQHYAQPAQSYGQPVYSSASAAPSDSNTAGRIGFIIGLIGLGLGVLLNVTIQIMIRSQGYDLINLVSGALSVIIFLAAATALAFGIIGLKRAGAPHGVAGIATGLGIAGVVNAGLSFVINALSSLFYF